MTTGNLRWLEGVLNKKKREGGKHEKGLLDMII